MNDTQAIDVIIQLLKDDDDWSMDTLDAIVQAIEASRGPLIFSDNE